MNKNICVAAFLLGLAVVCWVAASYVGSSLLALGVTVVIAGVYGVGAAELRRFHQETAALDRALATVPAGLSNLGEWLERLPPALRNPVRLRIEGERTGLPGPILSPYLAALLVLLGMLGTFLGMVLTLKGAVIALESTTDLQTIRAALAAPVKGLGVAFGTSVAGVAASAMLGLISALCRRGRLQASQRLDTGIATVFRDFSLAHQRQETFKALQAQSRALPGLVEGLQAMMVQMERQGQQLQERLLASQDRFHQEARGTVTDLAAAVDRSLKASLTDSARLAAETIQPMVAATMTGIARETTALHASLDASMRESRAALADTFGQRTAALLAGVQEAQSEWHRESAARDQERLAQQTRILESLAASLRREWQEAGSLNRQQQEQLGRTLADTAQDMVATVKAQSSHTLDEVGRLMETAAQAPRAAAEVIGQLRQELSASMARDNTLLEERSQLLETLGTLLEAINHASSEQRGAIDALVASAASLLDRVGRAFAERTEAESARLGQVAAQVSGSAVEVASLSEALGYGVQLFSDSNERLMATLQRIEGALDKSLARSDEQMAYYVAQAREIIDLSIMSQKQIVDDLQQLSGRQASLAEVA